MAIESPTDCEIEVAEILLQLSDLIVISALHSQSYFTWGARRKRSNPSTAAAVSSQPPPPELMDKASSPATPLSFSPSESDLRRRKHKKRKTHQRHIKMKRQDWFDHIEDLSRRGHLLKIEIQNVKSHYDKLEKLNSRLKSKKEEVTKESSELRIILGTNGDIDQLKPENQGIHHQPLIEDRTVQIASSDYHESPLGIPDLNIPIVEGELYAIEDYYQPLDFPMMDHRDLASRGRAMATEARRRRVEINKVKNSINVN